MRKQHKRERNHAKQLSNTSTIDYDKLADAIVRAHHKLVDEENTEQQKAEEHWKKCIGMNKHKNNVLRATNTDAVLQEKRCAISANNNDSYSFITVWYYWSC